MTKRLAILGCRGIPAKYGGFETFAEEIALRLVRKGIDVLVFCEAHEENQPSEFQGVRLEYVTAPRLGPLSTIIFDVICLWKARKSFDVVYMLGYGASPFCFIPRMWGSVVWINMDGVEWAREKWNFLARTWLRFCEAAAMRTANRIIADAEGIRTHLLARHNARPLCSVIAYGAEVIDEEPAVELIQDYEVAAYGYYLIVCRLEPENHVLEALQGFSESGSRHPLLVFGDKNVNNAYLDAVREFESEQIRLVGTLFDRSKLTALRWYCRAYIHGHSVGGTNPSLLEAMGCGNMIVAHDNPFNREVALDHARYFRSASDIPDIVGAVDEMKIDDATRTGPIERIRTTYSWEKIANDYLETLDQDFRATRMS